jgi:VWFA-related protein
MRLTASIAIVVALSVALLTPAASARQDRPTFKSNSELVVMHVSVRDRGGRYITGLTKDAFTVIDDGKPQTLDMFSADEVPATVGFLIDNSNSMRPNRERVVASAVAFARNSHPQDEIFVLTFNEKVRRAWGPSVVAETDPETFTSTMLTAITARGMTAIYDGIIGGLEWLGKARHTRQVLIVVSDGDDNASMATLEHALKQVHESDATVYTVALMDRIVRAVKRVMETHASVGSTLAIVSHGGAMRAFLEATCGAKVPPVPNTAVYVVEYDSVRFRSPRLL